MARRDAGEEKSLLQKFIWENECEFLAYILKSQQAILLNEILSKIHYTHMKGFSQL